MRVYFDEGLPNRSLRTPDEVAAAGLDVVYNINLNDGEYDVADIVSVPGGTVVTLA